MQLIKLLFALNICFIYGQNKSNVFSIKLSEFKSISDINSPNFSYFIYLTEVINLEKDFKDSLIKIPITNCFGLPLKDVEGFLKYTSNKGSTFKNTPFETTCLGKARRQNLKRWKEYQKFDPNKEYDIKYDLPDSSDLINLIQNKKIKVFCPCELTKQGVIPLIKGADCKEYGFRLVAWFEKRK